jgi:hypothetical protein
MVRPIQRVGGFVHDVDHIPTLSSTASNVVCLSDQTLYVLQNLTSLDIGFLTRYGEILDGGLYVPVTEGSPGEAVVNDVVNVIRRDLSGHMSIAEIISTINVAVANISCGCNVGQGEDNMDGERGGAVPDDVGDITYQEPSAVPDRDCKAANLLAETIRELFSQLAGYNVDDMATLGLAATVGIVTTIIASTLTGPMAIVIGAVAGILATFVARMFGLSVDFPTLVAVMDAEHSELVCLLYNSNSASQARDAYTDYLGSQPGISSAEITLLELIMTNAVMNTLFFDTPELAAFWPTYTALVDCSTCPGCPDYEYQVPIGSLVSIVDDVVTVDSAFESSGGFDREQAQVAIRCPDTSKQWVVGVSIVATPSPVPHPGTGNYRIASDPGGVPTEVYNSDTPWVEVCGRDFIVSSAAGNPFTAVFTFGSVCVP